MQPTPDAAEQQQQGMALIMVLIFTVLLYAMVSELVTTAQTARLTGENDLLLVRMRSQMEYAGLQIEDTILADGAGGDAEEGGDMGLGGAGGGFPGAGGGFPGAGGLDPAAADVPNTGAEGGEEGEEEDPSAQCDGSRDAWFQPQAFSDGDVTVYVWVEDENRKFNILSLVSPDQDFAEASRQRFARLIDALREGTEFDLSLADGEFLARNIIDWMKASTRGESLPRPPLKSDEEEAERSEITLPLHLDELLLLQGIDEDLYFDRVLDSRVIPGLESVLTVWTSIGIDPGDPDDPSRRPPEDQKEEGEADVSFAPDAGVAPEPGVVDDEEAGMAPLGEGIRININTAPRAVLRCLFSRAEVPDSLIEAILRYRNEPIEEDEFESSVPDDYLGDVRAGEEVKLQVFTSLDALEDIPEYENLGDPEIKAQFGELLTTESNVFSVHFAALHRRNEENRTFVLQRARSLFVRMPDEGTGLHPLILFEGRRGLRVMPVDLFEDDLLGVATQMDEMDDFSQEERAWNPFLIDFYRPKHEREEIFTYRDRLR